MAQTVANVTPFCVPGQREACWFFDRKKLIDESANKRAGIDIKREIQLRQQAALFVTDMGSKLQMPTLCVCSAIVYLHRFYVFHTFTRFNYQEMAGAALFLAAKAQECPRKLEHMVRVSYALQHRDEPPLEPKSDKYLEESQKIITLENILLKTLGFETDIELPHQDIVRYSQRLKGSKELAHASYFLCSQMLNVMPLYCLRYRPSFFACLCIYLASQWRNLEITSHQGRPFYTFIDSEATEEALAALSIEVGEYCDKMGDSCRIKRSMPLMRKTLPSNNGNAHAPSIVQSAASTSSAVQSAAPRSSVNSGDFRSFDDAPSSPAYVKKPASAANTRGPSPLVVGGSVAAAASGPLPLAVGGATTPISVVGGSTASSTRSLTPMKHPLDNPTPNVLDGASPPFQASKRAKTEVLDLHRYKERRNLLVDPSKAAVSPAPPSSGRTPTLLSSSETVQSAPPIRKSFIPDVSGVAVALAAESAAVRKEVRPAQNQPTELVRKPKSAPNPLGAVQKSSKRVESQVSSVAVQNPSKSAQNPSKSAQNSLKHVHSPSKSAQNPSKSAQNPPQSAQNPSKTNGGPAKTLLTHTGENFLSDARQPQIHRFDGSQNSHLPSDEEEEGEISDNSDTNSAPCTFDRTSNFGMKNRSTKSSLMAPPPPPSIPPPPLPPSPCP